jgi:hypothetical protein
MIACALNAIERTLSLAFMRYVSRRPTLVVCESRHVVFFQVNLCLVFDGTLAGLTVVAQRRLMVVSLAIHWCGIGDTNGLTFVRRERRCARAQRCDKP